MLAKMLTKYFKSGITKVCNSVLQVLEISVSKTINRSCLKQGLENV